MAQLTPAEKLQIDSLKYVIQTTTDDKEKIEAYLAWDDIIYATDPKLDLEINKHIAEICEFHLEKELSEDDEVYFKTKYASACNVMGIIYEERSVFPIALSYHEKSLDIQQELNNQKGIADSYNNMGILYMDSGDSLKAVDYWEKCIDIRNEIEDYSGTGNALNNIGLIYLGKKKLNLALTYFYDSKESFAKANDISGIGLAESNIGSAYATQGFLDSAAYYLESSVNNFELVNDKRRLSESLNQLAYIYNVHYESAVLGGRYANPEYLRKAIRTGLKSVENAEFIGNVEGLSDAHLMIYDSYQWLSIYDSALYHHKLAFAYKDSMRQRQDLDALSKLKYQYEYDKKTEQDSLKAAEEKKVVAERLEKEKTQRYALWGGIGVLVLFGGFIYNRFRKSQQQKAIIEEQKEVVEEQHQEILDSINYAKRIQAAILPPQKIVERHLPDSFILYLPKDVVAGDFYWLQHVSEDVLFAAADCTGHGVPGAMVSVVCNNALNRSVKEFGLTDPGKILDKTREIVIDEFSKSEENVQDGMDVALCRLSGMKLQFSGAQNPLWLLRNGELQEIKGDKQPVGKYDHQKNFTTHELELQKGDTIYLFSDGIVDQFGGQKGKKFKAKSLKELIIRNGNHSLSEQRENILMAFNEWKGAHEQIDDICMIGVRV